MTKTTWTALIVIVAIVVIGGLAFVTKPKAADGAPVKIGGLFAQTGYAAFAGEASRDGFLMAIEDSGMNITPVVEDFNSSTKTVVTAAQKLINVDHVSVVIGPEWAEFAAAVTPVVNAGKTVFVSPWMVSEDQLAPPYYFTATPSDRSKQDKLIAYMATHGVKKLTLVYSDNAWSLSGIKMFKEELAKDGRIEVDGEFKFPQEQTDYRTNVAKLKTLNPDAIYSLIATDDSSGLFNKQLREAGSDLQLYTDISRAESAVTRERFLQYTVGSIYPASKNASGAAAFEAKYEKRFGHKAGALSAATAYDMTTLVLQAIKNGAKTSEDIRAYLVGVKDYKGYSNDHITFNSKGQVISEDVVIKQATQEGSKVIAE